MDPLSIAASVAGLIGLAVQVAPSLQEYFSDVKHAKEDVDRYTNEIYTLVEVCERLQAFLDTDATVTEACFKTTESVLSRTVASVDECLRKLMQMMQVHGWGKRLKWPVYKSQVEKNISRLTRYTQVFQFALTVEGCIVLSRTPEDVAGILELQRDTSSKLHEITKGIAALEASTEAYQNTTGQIASILESIQSFTDPSQRLNDIQQGVGGIQRQLTDIQDKQVLDWLSSSERGRERHYEIRSRRTSGTGQWIFSTPAFQNWIDEASPVKLLWFVGAPGCGKSTLLSFVIDELAASQARQNTAIAYYYCDYRTQVTQPLALALGNILRMLVERLSFLPASLRELFENCRREERTPLSSELEYHIRTVSSNFSRSFILVDAMDEFSIEDPMQTSEMTRLLDSLAAAGLEILVTSRTLPSPSLRAVHAIGTLSAAESDIRTYVDHALHADDSMVDILDSQLESDISRVVVEQAKGMFLLVILHLQTIRGQVSRSGIRKALSYLTSDLSDAYDKTFEAIKHQSQSRQGLALQTLMWVSSSRRPLSSIELRHALATRLEDDDLDVDNIPPVRLIVRSCCGLVVVDDLDNDLSEVRLVHHTLHQYLHTRQQAWISHAHSMITRTCLSYLLFNSLHRTVDAKETHFALKQFALDYWGDHAALCLLKAYSAPAMQFLTDTERLRALYPTDDRITGLHTAAYFGLDGLIPMLLTSGHSVNVTDASEETALHKASAMNHPQTAALLLKHGADPNVLGWTCTTPLFIAVHNRNQELVRILLANGAIIDMPCTDLWTALHKAADIGDLEMVKYLVRKGSKTNNSSTWGLTALHRAAGRGHVDVMRFLLNEGDAQVDCVTRDNWTPLHGASSSGRVVAVSMLLNHGADIHWQGLDGRTALHRAVQGGYPETVERLIARGAEADVIKPDDLGDLPLHIAAREGYTEILDRLLEIKSLQQQQLSHLNERGWTPFQEAQLSGLYATEKHLGQQTRYLSGCTSASDENDNDDVLTEAIHTDDVDTICSFLDQKVKGIDIQSRLAQGRTLLHQAFHAGSYNTASALLSRGADIHARVETFTTDATIGKTTATVSSSGWQAIHFAALSGSPRAVQLCLDHGADATACTNRWQTPLHHACRSGNEETVRLLLDQAPDPSSINIGKEVDDHGWTPLHFAAAGGHGALLCLLVYSKSFDVSTLQSGFWAQLQNCAAKRGRHEVVEMVRGFRYSEYKAVSRRINRIVAEDRDSTARTMISPGKALHSISLAEYSDIRQSQRDYGGT